jgi:hypothetical protein
MNPLNFQPSSKALKNMFLGSGIRDPRSGIRKKPIPDPGSRVKNALDSGSQIRIRNTGHKKRSKWIIIKF